MHQPSEKLLRELTLIKDEINKQIPLASNFFPNIEACPPMEENLQDFYIQDNLHETLKWLMSAHFDAIEELEKAYFEFLAKQGVSSKHQLDESQKSQLQSFIEVRSKAIYNLAELNWSTYEHNKVLSYSSIKRQMLGLFQLSLGELGDVGFHNIELNEDSVIELFIEELQNQITAVINKVKAHESLTESELSLIKLYQRKGIPHEQSIQSFCNAICSTGYSSDVVNDATIELFHKDAHYNIQQLQMKLENRAHTYLARHESDKKVAKIKDSLKSNVVMTELETSIKNGTLDFSDKKAIRSVHKTRMMQCGLYYDLHKSDAGYCDEHARLGLVKIIESYSLVDKRLELVLITNKINPRAGHSFIVVNRAKGSKLNDMTTWGDDAILFDAWLGLVCYVKDINKLKLRYLVSFPTVDTEWQSLKFDQSDYLEYHKIKMMYDTFGATGNIDPEKREQRIIEEYALESIEKTSVFYQYLEDTVSKYRPSDFKHHPTFYITSSGDELVKFIPGFRTPVIALNKALLPLLAERKLSLTAFEFSIVVIMVQLTMYTSYVSPISIAPDYQASIDTEAVKIIKRTEAPIEFFRIASQFKTSCSYDESQTVSQYERNILRNSSLLRLAEDAIKSSYANRIKLLQSNLAAEVLKSSDEDVTYPSRILLKSLIEIGGQPSQIEPYITLSESTREEPDDSKKRIETLKELKAQLPKLKIELLPYENHRAASVRLREFCHIVVSLGIDYFNQEEANLVDEIINEANEMQIPGFDYLYYAFASHIGVHNLGHVNLSCVDSLPEQLASNTYYLVTATTTKIPALYYARNEKSFKLIPLNQVNGLPKVLLSINKKAISRQDLSKISFCLHQYQAVKALGFFKSVQDAVTRFMRSKSFEDALAQATVLANICLRYSNHLADEVLSGRLHTATEQQQANKPESRTRYYGSDLGKYIKWQAFNFSSHSTQDPIHVFNNFIEWAQEDGSGLIAATLYRLGFSNIEQVIFSLNQRDLVRFSNKFPYQSFIQLSYLTGEFEQYMNTDCTGDLSLYVAKMKPRKQNVNDSMFQDPHLTFEQAFVQFYDANLQQLIHPQLPENEDNAAKKILLKEFYRIAISGSEADKKVVNDFFFHREDNRDLKNLIIYQNTRGRLFFLNSDYASFIIFQNYNGFRHSLFDNYDLEKLLELSVFYFYDSEQATLEHWRSALRLKNCLSQEELFLNLMKFQDEKKLGFASHLTTSFVVSQKQINLFSKPLIAILQEYPTVGNFHPKVREMLSQMPWPKLNSELLSEVDPATLILHYYIFDFWMIFPSTEAKTELGKLILERVLSCGIEMRISLYEQWLFTAPQGIRKAPMSDISLKNQIINNLIKDYTLLYGKDDGTTQYYDKILPLITKLRTNLFSRDLKQVMSRLVVAIESQRKISEHVGTTIDPEDYTSFSSNKFEGVRQSVLALIKIADLFNNDQANQEALLKFLSNSLSLKSLEEMIHHLDNNKKTYQIIDALGCALIDNGSQKNQSARNEKISTSLVSLYNQFWDRTLQERAAIIEQVLIPATATLSATQQAAAYEWGLDYISRKLFPTANVKTSEDYLAYCLMRSYLENADNHIRSHLLTAMLVAGNEETGQKSSVGKKFALICKHMDQPAYTKLAQGVHSHPDTPAQLRDDLADSKGNANPPYRWSLWRQLVTVLPEKEVNKIIRVGRLLGSASYNLALEVTLEDNRDVVLLMLRENAETTSMKGFTHIRKTIAHCSHETVKRQSMMITQTIDEAARLSKNEMDKDISDQQARIAADLYPKELSLNIDNNSIRIVVTTAKVLQSGYGYRFIDRVYGEEFNSLPEITAQDKLVKRAVAKAVLLMELHNMLRGGRFDTDRHGAQLRVKIANTETGQLIITLGLYDFGELALELPSEQDIKQLLDILNRSMSGKVFSVKAFDGILTERIDQAVKAGESTHYLMRLRKAFLALHDFSAYLDTADYLEIFGIISKKNDLHPILNSTIQRLSFVASVFGGVQKASEGIYSGIAFFSESLFGSGADVDIDKQNALLNKTYK